MRTRTETPEFVIRWNGNLCGEEGALCDAVDLDDYDNYRCVKYRIALGTAPDVPERCEDCRRGRKGWLQEQ